jgi:O-antigen/teichoic acid export membrane protein
MSGRQGMSAPPTTAVSEPPESSEIRVTTRLRPYRLSADRLRNVGIKSMLSLLDQGMTSGAGFLVNLFLARWISPSSYGAFAVVFAGLLFASGFHNVLLLEPLSVFGPASHSSNLRGYFLVQTRVHFFLVGALSGLGLLSALVLWFVIPQSPVLPALAASAVALPFFLLPWLARRMCYVVQKPSLAVSGSFAYLVAVVLGLYFLRYLRHLSPFTVFLLMGVTSLWAAAVILWRLLPGLNGTSQIALSTRAVLKENWSYGRWLVGSAILFALSTQTQTFLAAGLLGLSAAGIIRAMQIPALVVTQVTTAVGLLVLPAFSYDFGRGSTSRLRRKANFVSLGLALGALCFAALLGFLAGRVEHLLYGGKYADFAWLMPLLALIPVFTGLAMGYSMALRASQKPYFDLIANVFAAPVAIVSALVFMHWWGIAGAVASMLLSFAVLTILTVVCYRWSLFAKSWVAVDGSDTSRGMKVVEPL